MPIRIPATLALLATIASPLLAQPYAIDLHVIGGGGGASSAASYAVAATVAESAAGGPLTAGPYTSSGGFWWAFYRHMRFADGFESGDTSRWSGSKGYTQSAIDALTVLVGRVATPAWTPAIASRAGAEARPPARGTGADAGLACAEDDLTRPGRPFRLAAAGFECGDLAGLIALDPLGERLTVGPWAALGESRLGLEVAVRPREPVVGVELPLARAATSLTLRFRIDASRLAFGDDDELVLATLVDGAGGSVARILLHESSDGGRLVATTDPPTGASSLGGLGGVAVIPNLALQLQWHGDSPITAVRVGCLAPTAAIEGLLYIDEIEVHANR